MLRPGPGFGKLAWKGVKSEVWDGGLLPLSPCCCLRLDDAALWKALFGRRGGFVMLSKSAKKTRGLGLGLAAALALGDAASWLGIWITCLRGSAGAFPGSGLQASGSRLGPSGSSARPCLSKRPPRLQAQGGGGFKAGGLPRQGATPRKT